MVFDSIIEIKIEIILNPLLGQIRDFRPLEPCAARCTVTKNAVLLRRFCLAQKIEQGSTIQLLIVLFLSADNRCANSCTAAGKQQFVSAIALPPHRLPAKTPVPLAPGTPGLWLTVTQIRGQAIRLNPLIFHHLSELLNCNDFFFVVRTTSLANSMRHH